MKIEKNIKKFDEFNKEQQKEILNNYRDINIDFGDWNDYILNNFIEEIKQKTDLDIKLNDIIWAVADRNSKFGVYSKDIINQLLSKFADNGVYDIDTTEKLGSFLIHRGGGICVKQHTELGLVEVYFEEDKQEQSEQNKAIIEQINNTINEVITLCSKYHNKNEEAYNYAISDEAIKETIEVNDFDVETKRIY